MHKFNKKIVDEAAAGDNFLGVPLSLLLPWRRVATFTSTPHACAFCPCSCGVSVTIAHTDVIFGQKAF